MNEETLTFCWDNSQLLSHDLAEMFFFSYFFDAFAQFPFLSYLIYISAQAQWLLFCFGRWILGPWSSDLWADRGNFTLRIIDHYKFDANWLELINDGMKIYFVFNKWGKWMQLMINLYEKMKSFYVSINWNKLMNF